MISRGLLRQFRTVVLASAAVAAIAGAATPASAQALAVVVNGDPVTTSDVEQQMILLRVLHQPASRNDAIESLIGDRLKLREANKYGIDCTDADLQAQISRSAAKAHMTTQQFLQALRGANGKPAFASSHLHSLATWTNYVKARNKGMSVSESDITAALARDPARAQDAAELTLQEVVFVTPVKATMGEVEQRLHEAQALRGRFTDCNNGLALARSLPNVAVKPTFRRDTKGLSDAARKALDETSAGHLTAPERVANGVQMIAVCAKDVDASKTTVRDSVQADLVADRLQSVGDTMYQDLRSRAVIERH